MKKTLFSVMAIVLAVGLVGGGAFAYFSDVETSTGNVFQAGTIDLSDPIVEAVKMEDLKPCETGYLVFVVHNDGNNPMHVWKHLYNVMCYENEVIEPEQEWYDANPGVSPKNDINTVIVYDIYVATITNIDAYLDCIDACMEECMGMDGVEEECLMVCGGQCAEWTPIVEPEDGLTIADVTSFYIYLGELEPCEWMVIVQSYHMEAETENWAQSDEMTFDVEFYAEQLNGPGPTPELPGYGR